jgi:hypothetical protein
MDQAIKEILERLERIEKKIDGPQTLKPKATVRTSGNRKGISGGIEHLIDSDFFSAPKGLSEIHQELRTNGWFCNLTSLPSYLLPLIKPPHGRLTRVTDGGKYRYVVRK